MQEHRVVVTGMGAVTPIGIGVETFWQNLIAGKSGISRVTHFDPSEYRSQNAAEVHDFDPEQWMDKKAVSRMDRFTQFGLAAATMAFQDAGLDVYKFDHDRAGVIIGSGIGGSATIEEAHGKLLDKGPKAMNPFFVSKLLINMAACTVSIQYDLRGPLSAPSVACSTGANAIGDAFRILQRGDAEIMIAGSSETAVQPLAYSCFCATRSMSTNPDPQSACRPFDKNRDGFVMGEGAGIVVLERLEHALARQAKIYAEIAGYGNTADAYHITAPDPKASGMIRVMKAALADAHLQPQEIGYINAHGTSTPLNDQAESAAILHVFGEHAFRLKVSSNKSMIGHLLAAAGSVECVATIKSIQSGLVPPTINYQEADPDCPLDYVITGQQTIDLTAAISNSFGFGGGNACLAIKKYTEKV
jgi:3-oxoacyl-[acyl-carrier-protein] synthase II